MKKILTLIFLAPILLFGQDKATELAHKFIITDGHVDLPYRLKVKNFQLTKEFTGIPVSSKDGDFDFERAKKGGLDAPFMSIYLPASLQKNNGASKLLADSLINMVKQIASTYPDHFALANSPAEAEANFKKGLISLPMGMENGSPIQGDLANLNAFYERGIRYITLAHSQANHISDSSYDLRRKWKGLSPFGKALVGEMNNIGIMLDISHVSDDAFYQVIELTKAPVIASHSSLRRFTPGFERNMNDDMIKKLGENGGVIMINFGSSFVSAAPQEWQNKLKAKLEKENAKWGEEKAERIAKLYKENNPYPFASLDTVLDHIDHVKNLVGVDYIGIGSDYDGVGDSLPRDLKDVSYYPQLVQGLMNRGYSDADIKKILSGNFMRVWKQVEQFAAKSK